MTTVIKGEEAPSHAGSAPSRVSVACLPGLDGSSELRAPFLHALQRRVEAASYLSLPGDSISSYDDLERYILASLPDATAGLPYVLVGYSYTGPLAMRLAQPGSGAPPGLLGVVLVATFARLSRLYAPRPIIEWVARHPTLLRIPLPNWALRLLAGRVNSVVLRQYREAQRAVAPDILAGRLNACLEIDCRRELSEIMVPILRMPVTRDLMLTSAPEREMAALRPDAEVTPIKGGHGVIEREPELCATLIAEFAHKAAAKAMAPALG